MPGSGCRTATSTVSPLPARPPVTAARTVSPPADGPRHGIPQQAETPAAPAAGHQDTRHVSAISRSTALSDAPGSVFGNNISGR